VLTAYRRGAQRKPAVAAFLAAIAQVASAIVD
jgi:hypothetical protein